jgi:thiol-disulfide isomerase/thioredoxin
MLTYDNSIYTIRGNNVLKDFISRPNRDKLVLFYASFCKHCERMMPAWKEAAKELSYLEEDGFMIGQIDMAKNDIEYS